jgi:xylulokinase
MFLGIDLGTGSVKVLLLQADGTVHDETSRTYPVNAPADGWAESDPEAWWQATCDAVREIAHDVTVRAIGLSGQMHGVVLCDDAGTPLRDAVLWADARSEGQLERYRSLPHAMHERLANPLAVGMAGPTLLWLSEHEPDTYQAARWALQPKDWLRLKLTGEVFAEPSDASATLLYDLPNDDWAFDIIGALGLNGNLFAPLVESDTLAGSLSHAAAEALGLRPHVPVAAGSGDASAALLGSGLLRQGAVQLSVGTAAQITAIRDTPVTDKTLRTHLYRAALPGRYFAMAAMQNAGLALEWVRRQLGVSWEAFYQDALQVPAGSDGVVFVPHLSGERTPHVDAKARGAWVGLGLNHERGHLARAALEGVAFSLKAGLQALRDVGVTPASMRLAGGGTVNPQWQQLLATVLEMPLEVVEVPSASARGAAYLAALAVSELSEDDIIAQTPDTIARIEPEPMPSALKYAWHHYQHLYPALKQARIGADSRSRNGET